MCWILWLCTVLHPKLNFFRTKLFFFPGPSILHDFSYKVNFMAAVRLWKKRDEEKGVWELFFFSLHTVIFGNYAVKGKFLLQENLQYSLTTLRCCSKKWLSLRRPWRKKTNSSIPAGWLLSFGRTTYLVLRKNWKKDKTSCQKMSLRLWLTRWKKR